MLSEDSKRKKRMPLTSQEVFMLIQIKKNKELQKLADYKKKRIYKLLNIFNILCFFLYTEMLFCFFGPCNYQTLYSSKINIQFGDEINSQGKRIISKITITTDDKSEYQLVIQDFIEKPISPINFLIGKDYILQKSMKGILTNSEKKFRLLSASSNIFLAAFLIFISIICFWYNLNQNYFSLMALSIFNLITFLFILSN